MEREKKNKIPEFQSLEEEKEYWEARGPLAEGHEGKINKPRLGQKRSEKPTQGTRALFAWLYGPRWAYLPLLLIFLLSSAQGSGRWKWREPAVQRACRKQRAQGLGHLTTCL